MNLIKKIIFMLKGKANDAYEKSSNPAESLRQVAREVDAERKSFREQYVNLDSILRENKASLEEKEKQYEESRKKAKDLKATDEKRALVHAGRCVKIKEQIERLKSNIAAQEEQLTNIEHTVEELAFQYQDLKQEATMAETQMKNAAMMDKRSTETGAGTDHDGIVQAARERVQAAHHRAQSQHSASVKFDGASASSDEDAKALLEEL